MPTIDKTKSQTYDFLSKNKSIEDIKQQAIIKIKEKRRHGGKTIKFFNKINKEPLWIVENDNLSENEIVTQTKSIEEKSDVNLIKYSYNAITIYDEKQKKDTGIEKIHEEFLPIADKVFFITTFVHINQSISEEIMYFHHFKNGDNEVIKQLKQYKNISKYKDDLFLIESNSNHEKNIKIEPISIKDFLKLQQELKVTPTWGEITTWIITWLIIPIGIITIGLIHPPLLIMSFGLGIVGLILRGSAELFSPTAKKVWSWLSNKCSKNFEQKEKVKIERQSIIKNLTSDKLETKLDTQYDILKQELDNRKDMKPDKLISNNTINNNSNSIIKNSSIESESKNNFDSSIRNTINHQDQQSSTISANTWNKVKCLLT